MEGFPAEFQSCAGLYLHIQEQNVAPLEDVIFKTLCLNKCGQLIYCPFYDNDVLALGKHKS